MSEPEPEVEWLRDAFAQRSAANAASPPVEPEEIWDAANGDAEAEQVSALASKVVDDPALAEEWRMAIHATEAMSASDNAPHQEERSGRAWLWMIAAAAAVAVAVALARTSAPDDEAPSGQVRGGEAENVWGVDPTKAVSERTLRWTPIDDARAYRVQLFDERLEPLHESAELTAPQFEIPPNIHGPLRWQVHALLKSGRTERSPTFRAAAP